MKFDITDHGRSPYPSHVYDFCIMAITRNIRIVASYALDWVVVM
jgi:hypothetical protein